MKSIFQFCLLFILLTTFNIAFAEEISGTTKIGFESNYVTYGTRYSEATISPMIDISKGSYFAGVWGYIPQKPTKDFEGEWDYFAGKNTKINNLISFDIGATVYKYPRTDVDPVTVEGFLYLNLNLPANPKIKLFHDVVVNNWIGEVEISHTFKLNNIFGILLKGQAGFRNPENHSAWYYATASADILINLNSKTVVMCGARATDNTDHVAVGHGLHEWYGLSAAYNW
ncbi:MAG: TorF family putative porin [Opitutaceae bacterium]